MPTKKSTSKKKAPKSKKKKATSKKRKVNRSSVDGKFVTPDFAQKHKSTTQTERIS